jgi:ESS family glutamate:Na+ symporter
MSVLQLDLIQTLACGGLVLFVGHGLCRFVPILARYNLPAPIVGGLLVAVVALLGRNRGVTLLQFDTTLQSPLMIAFFTTIGFGASLSLLRAGGPQVVLFFIIASALGVVQNLVGMLVALPFGLHPLFGVLAGSVTLMGGPATGLAFAPLFEQAGVPGASTVAIAVAMGGIIAGGIVGGPVSTLLIERHRLRTREGTASGGAELTVVDVEVSRADVARGELASVEESVVPALKNVVVILVAMGFGAWISRRFAALGVTLPAYIGAMLAAAAIRNLDDATGWLRLSHGFIDRCGAVALSLFLALALMTLKLSELAGLALPLLAILLVQVVLTACIAGPLIFRAMGRTYDAAVMTGGFIGFMLGTTANAMAVMRALVERYGPSPRAFLVAPMVGAFFIDFSNALIITTFVNLLS